MGAIASPSKLAAIVVYGVESVLAPTIPTFTPATSTITDAGMFGHAIRAPVCLSRMLAETNGNRASAARALSAPRASSVADPGVAAGPAGPKSNSWLPTAAAA